MPLSTKRFVFIPLFIIGVFATANAGIVVKNGLSHLYDVSLGKVYQGTIEIQNTSDSEQSVKIYQRDYQFYFDGQAVYNQPGSHSRSNATWIDLEASLITLKAKEERIINYEITVPEAATLPGTSWSVIMLEGVKEVDPNNFNSISFVFHLNK